MVRNTVGSLTGLSSLPTVDVGGESLEVPAVMSSTSTSWFVVSITLPLGQVSDQDTQRGLMEGALGHTQLPGSGYFRAKVTSSQEQNTCPILVFS